MYIKIQVLMCVNMFALQLRMCSLSKLNVFCMRLDFNLNMDGTVSCMGVKYSHFLQSWLTKTQLSEVDCIFYYCIYTIKNTYFLSDLLIGRPYIIILQLPLFE